MHDINIKVTETGCQHSPLLIGYQGENEVTRVIVDYSAWTEEFGAGSLALEVMRSGDEIPYLAPLTIADGKAVWLVSNVDTGAEGVGAAGFVYTVGDQIKKSAVIRFFVGRDIGGDPGERPDPYEGVIAHIEKLVKEAEDNAAAAETAQAAAETAQTAAETAQSAAASSATDAAGSATTATEQAQAATTDRAAAEAARQAAETAKGAAETAQQAAEASQQAIENMTVSAETIDASSPAVEKWKDEQTGAVNLNFGFPKNQATTATTIGPAPIATFDASAADMPLKGLTVNIEPVQSGSGDPSPENVRPITGWTGCNIIQGQIPANLTWTEKKTINASGTIVDNNDGAYSGFIPVQIGKNLLAFNATEPAGRIVRVHGYTSDGQWNSQLAFHEFNAADNPIGIKVMAFDVQNNGITKIRLSTDNFASFELLDIGKHIPITFPAGTVYGGTLDVVNKKLTVDRAAVDLGSLTWDINDSWGVGGKLYSTVSDPLVNAIGASNNNQKANIMCSHFAAATRNELYDNIVNDAINLSPLAFFQLRTTTNYDTAAEVKAAMDGVSVVYMLREPITYDLVDIPEILTLYGTNNIWADCGDVTVTYGAYLETVKAHAERLGDSILSAIAPLEASYAASRAYAVGEFLFVGTKFYKVISAIAEGGTITPGTNAVQTTVAEQLADIESFRILVQPESLSVAVDQSFTMRVIVNRNIVTYRWQYQFPNNDSWVDWTNGANSILSSTAKSNWNGLKNRVIVSYGGETIISNTAILTVTG